MKKIICCFILCLFFKGSLILAQELKKEIIPWGHKRIGVLRTWEITKGQGIKVAVIDTGVSNHPDLRENIKKGSQFFSKRRLDEQYEETSAADGNIFAGHGTHVAGIIAALENGQGIVGVAPQAELYIAKVYNDLSQMTEVDDLISAIYWAIEQKVQVINLSLTLERFDAKIPALNQAIQKACQQGIVVVLAAGNYGEITTLADAPEAIVVTAIDQNNQVPERYARHPRVDLAAPGVLIQSTSIDFYGRPNYRNFSGTSMATAYVSGLVALMLARPIDLKYDANKNGRWDPQEVKQKLIQTAEDLGAPGKDNVYGYGLVNAARAVSR